MFPSARNSLQRGNSHRRKIPVPAAVHLYNLMTELDMQQVSASSGKWYRPAHTLSLLRRVRLEIVVVELEEGEDEEEGKEDQQSERLERAVYNAFSATQSANPTWEHLDERMDLPVDWWKDAKGEKMYKSMKVRFILSSADQAATRAAGICLLEIPLHPSALKKLDALPEAFPPNSCLIHFSDGSVRCMPNLHQILVDEKVVQLSPQEVEEFLRFEDDVFRTLDTVPTLQDESETESQQNSQDPPSDTAETPEITVELSEGKEGESDEAEFRRLEAQILLFDGKEEEKQLLESILKEESLIENQISALGKRIDSLKAVSAEVQRTEMEIAFMKKEISTRERKLKRDALLSRMQKIKLLTELESIYSIECKSTGVHTICGLRLSPGLNGAAIPDDEKSAALGFICHLVSMMSKYTCIQLRHRIICNSSRSGILLDKGTLLPLFEARIVEREHLDMGIALLNGNIDNMIGTLGVKTPPQSSMLHKLQLIFNHVIDRPILS